MTGLSIHYRYLEPREPSAYPALQGKFRAAMPVMSEWLREIDSHRDALLAFAEDHDPPSPRLAQSWFPTLDALAAYTIVARTQPDWIIEIGSVHSTRFLSAAIAHESPATRLACIDPQPRRALDGLKVDWHEDRLQNVALDFFDCLTSRSILFVDSSHVLMDGSDVDIVLNQILPRLPAGLLLHVHDIMLPDAYPRAWQDRHYNEQQALAPLLACGALEIIFGSHFVRHHMNGQIEVAALLDKFPQPMAPEGSLWARLKCERSDNEPD